MTRAPKVSVLMLTYDRPQRISRAIESVRSQSFEDWELLVVQDGSNSETHEIMREWTGRDARIRHFSRGAVGTIAEASNYGLRNARGEHVAILDDDDYWSTNDKLARQVEFLDRNPDHVACGGGYVLMDVQGNERARFLKPETDARIRSAALLANPIGNSTALFRRLIGGELMLYDETMKGFADWDFWLQLGTLGKLYNFPEYLAHYSLWEGGGSFQRQGLNTQASIRIVRKFKGHYRWYWPALILAYLYLTYSKLPVGVRRYTYPKLSSLKKSLASSRGDVHSQDAG